MDGARFDAWTRQLTQPRSRRSLARTLAAGWLVAGGTLAAGGAARGAPCKARGKPCDKNGDCCQALTCKHGNCACERQTKPCGDTCCGKQETCVGKGKQQACCPAAKACGTECCGPHRACVCPKPPSIPGVPPGENPPCVCRCEDGWTENAAGQCVCNTTLCGLECCEEAKGERCCDGRDATTCTNVKISKQHCGECGHSCPPHHDCVAGACVCAAGYVECEGKCIEVKPGNCCAAADCVGEEFPAHTICCDNVCRANFGVEDHCGGCGIRCGAGEMCCDTANPYFGQCLPFAECCASIGKPGEYFVCKAPPGQSASAHCCQAGGQECCEGHCTWLDTAANCGACGNTCATGETCCNLPPAQGGPGCLPKRACNRRRHRSRG